MLLRVAPALLFLFSSLAVHAEGKLDILGKFLVSDGELDIATYTDGAQKVGLLGLKKDQTRVSVAFAPDEWESLQKLWQKGSEMQAGSWQFVGSFKESGSKVETLLVVAAGPGVQFIVIDPDKTVTIVLTKADFDKFQTSLNQVKEYLAH